MPSELVFLCSPNGIRTRVATLRERSASSKAYGSVTFDQFKPVLLSILSAPCDSVAANRWTKGWTSADRRVAIHHLLMNNRAMESVRRQLVLPLAVDAHLEELLQRTLVEGSRTSRSEIVAALVWGTDLGGDELGVVVRNYRRSIQTAPAVAVLAHGPGPRPALSTQSR